VVELTLRIGFSLLVILGLMWGLARLARRPLAARSAGAVAVLSRQHVSRNASVVVVRVADRALVLGVTEQHVTLLTETDLAVVEGPAAAHRSVVELDVTSSAVAGGYAATSLPATSAPAARPPGRLAGSALSPHTWTQAVSALRERTVRR